MALKGLLGNRRAEHAHHNQHHHHHHQQPASSSNAQHEFTFKWGNKRRQVFGTRAANLHDTSLVSSSSAVSNDAPPLRYSNANLRVAGWLTKRGKRLGSRVDRYFELNGSVLSNARSEHSNPTWTVNVRGSKVLAGPGREIIFKVDKSFTSFFAPTDELHDKWIKALQAVCADVTDFYDFGKVIGRGAYSEVYLARDKQRNELCAIKVLERSNTEHAKLIDRELEVLRLLNHQNIVQIYDIFDSARETFVVMEYLAGGELLEMITENDHLSEKNSKQVIREVLQAVHYLHARGIVHRDVKPENILCVNRGWPLRVKITDFGLSKSVGGLGDDDAQRVMRSQCGTAYYLAPEIANSLPYGKPVDLWACGVVLYVMLAGKFPFYGKSGDKFMRRLRAGVRFPEEEWNGISADAKALVRGLLDPSPASRLTAAQALEHRWLVDEADVTASSMPSRAVVEAQQKVQRRFNAATEPLSLQLAQFSASNRRARARTGGALEVGEMEETGAGVVRTDDHEEVYAGGSSDGGAMDGNKSELVLEPQLIVDHEV
eukprot:TRINITY_DN1300_c0_g1_i1.p1 TRINITY_DN1300_c0_g1~~TRINITY_DN1300_c0_g1_i1.p1  ORF type:complete len:634 (-),score=105.65 TRINITY_DN1300_c0_g1_i1:5701-7335(-)